MRMFDGIGSKLMKLTRGIVYIGVAGSAIYGIYILFTAGNLLLGLLIGGLVFACGYLASYLASWVTYCIGEAGEAAENAEAQISRLEEQIQENNRQIQENNRQIRELTDKIGRLTLQPQSAQSESMLLPARDAVRTADKIQEGTFYPVQEEAGTAGETSEDTAVTQLPEAIEEAMRKTVTFGHYNQTGSGEEPVEWLVLGIRDNQALVISRYGLDAKPYNTKDTNITWETCSLRKWLNSDFLNTAFSSEEQQAIAMTTVDNGAGQGNNRWSADGGNNTQDKVFLLSYKEAGTYFKDDVFRRCVPTAYAKANGAYTVDNYKVDGADTGWWWLRSPGSSQNYAAGVSSFGALFRNDVSGSSEMVRPALIINLDSGLF